MKFKSGDLAIIVKTHPTHAQHLGRIVELTRLSRSDTAGTPGWETIPQLRSTYGREIICGEGALLPIRDQPGEDEMLRIAGKPGKVDA